MRILVIDDDPDIREVLPRILMSESFVVDTADDGERGAALACANDYDLIILDHNLPKKNGQTVCEYIRGRGRMMPILILSVVDEIANKITLLNSGADDYLTKPFSAEELIARIRAILRRPKITNEVILQIEDLIVDVIKQTVKRGRKIISLTNKQFMILELLLRHKDEVVSRPTLMEHIWDMNADAWSNTLETHIYELRRKIDHNSRKKLIHTIPGRGYKLGSRL